MFESGVGGYHTHRIPAIVAAQQQLGLVADAFGEDAAPLLAPEDGLVIVHTDKPLVQQSEAVLHLATMAAEDAAAVLPEIEVDSR